MFMRILSMVSLLMASYLCVADTTTISGVNFDYDFVDDGIRILHVNSYNGETTMELPSEVNGVAIVDIASNAIPALLNGTRYCRNLILPKRLKRLQACSIRLGEDFNMDVMSDGLTVRFPKTLEQIDNNAAHYYDRTMVNGYWHYENRSRIKCSIFDGPPPEVVNYHNDAYGNNLVLVGDPSASYVSIYVNDKYYDAFSNTEPYRRYCYYGYSNNIRRGMPGLTINPDVDMFHKADGQLVSFVCTNTNAQIFYTIDGSEPQAKATATCFRYTDPFAISNSITIKAIALVSGYPYATIEERAYRVDQPVTPIITPVDDGLFDASGYGVRISCSDMNATIRYTLDGTEVTESSPIYKEDIRLSDTTTIRAKAFEYGRFDSKESMVTFSRTWRTVETPVVSPSNSFFENVVQNISISCETDDAIILYTTDGSDPSVNGREYKGEFSTYESCIIRVIARKYDWHNSDEVTVTLTRAEPLSEAVNLYGYLMENDSTSPWSVVTDVSHDGVSCVKSGTIGNNGTTAIQTSVKKAGTLSFWWRAACEESDVGDGEDGYYDYGAVVLDGTDAVRIAGNDTGWLFFSTNITTGGKHVFRWEYRKDGATTYVPDCVWLDQVQWIPADGSGYTLTTPEPVPYSWLSGYGLGLDTDFETAAKRPNGKMVGGRAMSVWQDYVAGTDPTNTMDFLRAAISFSNGMPCVSWSPNLNTNGEVRVYTVLGKTNLTDAAWVCPTNAAHRFFKVKVEMP